MLLDTEELQKDLREIQAMNEKLRAENHSLLSQVADLSRSLEEKEKESPDESDAQLQEAGELQQVLADRALISQLREEVGHLQVFCACDAMFSCIQEKSITKISKNSRVSFYLCMRDQSDDILIYFCVPICSAP